MPPVLQPLTTQQVETTGTSEVFIRKVSRIYQPSEEPIFRLY